MDKNVSKCRRVAANICKRAPNVLVSAFRDHPRTPVRFESKAAPSRGRAIDSEPRSSIRIGINSVHADQVNGRVKAVACRLFERRFFVLRLPTAVAWSGSSLMGLLLIKACF